jgi:hypothetical protein
VRERDLRARKLDLKPITNLVEKTGLVKILGIEDPLEIRYLTLSLAWNINRKIDQEIAFVSRHPLSESRREGGGIDGWLTRQMDSMVQLNEDFSLDLLDQKKQVLEENPLIFPVANAIDRTSNMLSLMYVEAKRDGPFIKKIGESKVAMAKFRNEISEARTLTRVNL